MSKNLDKGADVECGEKVPIMGHRCYRCKHEWRPNNLQAKPRVCPSCKSPYWDKPRKNGKTSASSAKKQTKNPKPNTSK